MRAGFPRVQRSCGLREVLVLLALWLTLAVVAAEPTLESHAVAASAAWPPAPPPDSRWDWIQLTSGEWLKGELRSMARNVVDFDSDKLDELSLKWKDIRAIYTAKPMAVLQRDNSVAVGRLQMTDGRLTIEGAGHAVAHDDVLSIAKGTQRELDRWFGNIAVGMDLRDGNVDQKDISADLNLRRRTAQSSLRLNYIGNYAEFDSVENANDHRVSTTYDYRLSRYWFVRPLYAEYFRDPFQNIDSRVTVGPGFGYYVFDEIDLSWTVSAGPAYQRTRYDDVPSGESRTVSTRAGFLSTNYDQELTSDLDVTFSYQVILMDDASGRAAHHAMLAFDVDLTRYLDLRLAGYWDRLEKPQPNERGERPQKDDFRVVVGLDLEL